MNNQDEAQLNTEVTPYTRNRNELEQTFQNIDDFMIKDVTCNNIPGYIAYIETVVDGRKLFNFVYQAFLQYTDLEVVPEQIAELELSSKPEMMTNFPTSQDVSEAKEKILTGVCVIGLEGSNDLVLIDVSLDNKRSINEPADEKSIQGSHQGFIEKIRTNIGLIRQSTKSTDLVVNFMQIGAFVKTELAIVYMGSIANPDVVNEVKIRAGSILMDQVVSIGFLEELIEDTSWSPFRQLLNTERVDVTVSCLNEGRVAIFLEGSSTCLIVPVSFFSFLQSADDYNTRWMVGTVIRSLRFISLFVAILLPAFYIAVVGFHLEVLPDVLVITVQKSINKVPFPPLIEALLMELTIELIREAGLRLPSRVGQTVGIVGGLVIGDAIVRAGLISTTMVIVVAVTALAGFTIPTHGMSDAIRLLRFPFMFLAAAFGFVGIVFATIVLLGHLCKLESFGTPYFAPFAPFRPQDLKDTFVRAPLWKFNTRPLDAQPRRILQQTWSKGWKYYVRKKR
jgi:spore germination protein KA